MIIFQNLKIYLVIWFIIGRVNYLIILFIYLPKQINIPNAKLHR